MKPLVIAMTLAALLILPTAASASDSLVCDVTLLSITLDFAESYSDVWGYEKNGDEYAVIGHHSGTAFYRVTDPANPVLVGNINGPNSGWRDIKSYLDYIYVGTEGGGGIQIIDVSSPNSPALVATYNATVGNSHNLFIDVPAARLYAVGTSSGTVILDISTPTSPSFLGSWGTHYVHDLYVENDTAYASTISFGGFHILDVSNPASVSVLTTHSYANAANHNAWVHPNHDYLVTSDEAIRGPVRVWDISDFQNILQVDQYKKAGFTSAHNAIMKDSICYVSYYTEGLRIVDMTDPPNSFLTAWYDTSPLGDVPGTYTGNWGVYPFLSSGTLVLSDMQKGLFLVRWDPATSTGVESGDLPVAFRTKLMPNEPNPFNPTTRIRFALEEPAFVDLAVYDLGGRLVRQLAQGQQPAGEHAAVWDGTDGSGREVASGTYFYSLRAGNEIRTRKLNLIR